MRFILLVIFFQYFCLNTISQCWKEVFNSGTHTFAIQEDGSLWGWGSNNAGELSLPTQGAVIYPTQIGNEINWKKVTMGYSFSIALKNDGTLWSTGKGGYGESGTGENFYAKYNFNQIGSDNNWVDVEAGHTHVIALKNDGTIWTWGHNDLGQLGLGNYQNVNVPTRIGNLSNWTKIASTGNAAFALNNLADIYSWGFIAFTQNLNEPTLFPGVNHYQNLYTGQDFIFALAYNNDIYCYGFNEANVLTLNLNPSPSSVYNPTPFPQDFLWLNMSGGKCHGLGIKYDNSMWSWGCNNYGQLGLNNFSNTNTLQQIGMDQKWLKIKAGNTSSFAINDKNELWAFGENTQGQLGDSTKISRSTMVQIKCPQKIVSPTGNLSDFYPNPINDYYNYKFDKPVTLINVYDMLGFKVLTETDISGKIDLSKLKQGIYVIDFTIEDLHLQHKVIKI